MADENNADIVVTATKKPTRTPEVAVPSGQTIDQFAKAFDKARADIRRDWENTRARFEREVRSSNGAGIDETSQQLTNFFERTADRIDEIDGKKDGLLTIPVQGQEPINIRETLSNSGINLNTLKRDIKDALSAVDVDRNGRITPFEASVKTGGAADSVSAPKQSSMPQGGDLFGGLLDGLQPPTDMKYDKGTPPHDPATSSPPAAPDKSAPALKTPGF